MRSRKAPDKPPVGEPGLLGLVADELGEELDRLYELPPGEFTAARDEAAKRLRAEGRRELADEVKRLRKPTLPVWLANSTRVGGSLPSSADSAAASRAVAVRSRRWRAWMARQSAA